MSPAPWNSEPVMGYRQNNKNDALQQGGHQGGGAGLGGGEVDHAEESNGGNSGSRERNFKSIPTRPSPIVHPAVDAPICPECQALEMTFFNPECKACQNELETMAHHGIGIASIFAILRQWIPQVGCIKIKSTPAGTCDFAGISLETSGFLRIE